MKKRLIIAVVICFLFSFAIPMSVSATTNEEHIAPRASYYLDAYSAYVYVTPSGEVQVWFDVMGTGDMDEIGALSILLYESTDGVNWTWAKTWRYEATDGMLFYDDWYVSSYVSCQGSTNKQYKANVCVWAGKNGNGDSRNFWAYQP